MVADKREKCTRGNTSISKYPSIPGREPANVGYWGFGSCRAEPICKNDPLRLTSSTRPLSRPLVTMTSPMALRGESQKLS